MQQAFCNLSLYKIQLSNAIKTQTKTPYNPLTWPHETCRFKHQTVEQKDMRI